MQFIDIKTTRSLMATIHEVYGDDFQGINLGVFSRRVGRAMDTLGFRDPFLLDRALREKNDTFYDRFLSLLVPTSTEMFRDPAFWRSLRELLLDDLLGKYGQELSCWVASPDHTEELYSLLIVLEELGLRRHAKIYYSYLGESERARMLAGEISAAKASTDVANYTRYSGTGDLGDYLQIKNRGRYLRQDLLEGVQAIRTSASFPNWYTGQMHLVLCRNQFLYFSPSLSERNLQVISKSMVSGGILALGIKERLGNLGNSCTFIALNEEEGLYRNQPRNG